MLCLPLRSHHWTRTHVILPRSGEGLEGRGGTGGKGGGRAALMAKKAKQDAKSDLRARAGRENWSSVASAS